jgi:hypothetical protein
MVNGLTGEVQGEKPISWIRVTVAMVIVLAVIAIIIYFASQGGNADSLGFFTGWGIL